VRAHTPRPYAWIAVVVGVLIAVGAPLGWSLVDHPSGVQQVNRGAAASIAAQDNSPSVPPATATRPGPGLANHTTLTPVPSASQSLTEAANAAPIRLSIPSLRINAPIIPVEVDGHGDMQIPAQISTVGWYKWGPAPGGSRGSIVIAGHVDSAIQGLGAFFYLHNIRASATVTVTLAGGQVKNYRVIGLEEFPKTTVPLPALFARSGPERLTLITCGGAFDHTARSYHDNVVVTAVPA
jgi:sortase (surface protein transpeptidase)